MNRLKSIAGKVHRLLASVYHEAECELVMENPYQTLVATILSAQCTDVSVNKVTKSLFKKYKTINALSRANVLDVEKYISSINLYHNKARFLVECAKEIMKRFDGEIPDTIEELIILPGVGRKTANCVLVNGFGKPGLMCDTHVCRVTKRLGFHSETKPDKIEQVLSKCLPDSEWGDFCHRIILHGRRVCKSRKPDCAQCVLSKLCAEYKI